jgi:hypothetical protein
MECPCEECITYVMCRERVITIPHDIVLLAPLTKYCDSLSDYLFEETKSTLKRFSHVRLLFKKESKK